VCSHVWVHYVQLKASSSSSCAVLSSVHAPGVLLPAGTGSHNLAVNKTHGTCEMTLAVHVEELAWTDAVTTENTGLHAHVVAVRPDHGLYMDTAARACACTTCFALSVLTQCVHACPGSHLWRPHTCASLVPEGSERCANLHAQQHKQQQCSTHSQNYPMAEHAASAVAQQ
jgi:hypothetical protein